MGSPNTTVWLQTQVSEWSRLRPSYQQLADILEAALGMATARLAPLAMIQTRTKSISSFAEKALRKQHKYVMPAHQLTDLCGARVIVRTLTELEAMSRAIETEFDVDWENSLDVARRLPSSQFGYRSVHYVVSLRPGTLEDDVPAELYGFDCDDCGVRHPLKAEIQLRTTVQHAWADFAHDLTYKGALPLPARVERDVAVIAAELEDVDQAFERIDAELRTYADGAGSYLTAAQLEQERDLLDTVRQHSPDADLAVRSARLSMRLGDWRRAVDVLEPFIEGDAAGDAPVAALTTLGMARCRLHRTAAPNEIPGARELLERAVELDPADADALRSLAESWTGTDDQRARQLYLRAVELDPADHRALGALLELHSGPGAEIVRTLARPLVAGAMARCRAQARLGVDVPWTLFDLGRFHLLRDEPYEALHAYALGLAASTAAYMPEEALASLGRLASVLREPPGVDWVRRLLVAGLAARFPSSASRTAIADLATPGVALLQAPVVIVAGGTDAAVESRMRAYRDLLEIGLGRFDGTVLSGGTQQGISGVVGAARMRSGASFTLIGYLPRDLPVDASPDERYDELRRLPSATFSPFEPLQNWIDLLAAGVDPGRVRVLGINGGPIAALEYRIAAAMGATVGLVESSGREAARLLADTPWMFTPNIVPLPHDPATVRAFVNGCDPGLDPAVVETLARTAHEVFLRDSALATSTDPARQDWAHLREDLRESNRSQARHYAALLDLVGCTIAPAGGSPGRYATFTPEDVERMAVAEHGRWTAERLLAGWRWGPDRDPERRITPYVVAWDQLPPDVQEIDRRVVRRIPEVLAEAGLEVRRRDQDTGD